MLEYSIIIRTTGKANDKYQKLLNSIKNLVPLPKEIIVVLPENSQIPKEKLGSETYYFCPKGMVRQRLERIKKCKTKYALVCDDDLQFPSDFVEKLAKPVLEKKCSLSAGPLYTFLPHKGVNSMLCIILGSSVPTLFHKKKYIHVLNTSGYSYNKNLQNNKNMYYDTDSVAWTCFFADVKKLKSIRLEDEVWLDMHGYSYLDDQTMFYKGKLMNIKTMVVPEAIYIHLDGKTSTKNNNKAVLYSIGFNRTVFWHRFLFKMKKNSMNKLWTIICFGYWGMSNFILDFGNLLRGNLKKQELKIKCKGYFDAFKYIKSKRYKELPNVLGEENE